MTNFLSSDHWVHIQDPAGREVYVLSGTCILDPPLRGPSDGSRWQRGETNFAIPLHDLPSGQGLVIEQWAPTVVLGSIQNEEVANNAGWAVDDFDLVAFGDIPVTSIAPRFDFAVGDTDGYTMRVAYSVTVVGRFAPLPINQ
jgi:hypothetical protein